MPDVLTMGSFDGMHPGHIGLLERCRNIAGEGQVTVAINTAEFIHRFKHHWPIYSYAERYAMADACRYVDRVVENDGDAQPRIIAHALPEGGLIVIGDDWKPPKDYLAQIDVSAQFLAEIGAEVRFVPRTGDWSTTELRTRLT